MNTGEISLYCGKLINIYQQYWYVNNVFETLQILVINIYTDI